MGWTNSVLKYDHSVHLEAGKRVRFREKMNFDSTVPSPEIYNMKDMHTRIRAARLNPDGLSVHVEHEDRAGAEVRDVQLTIIELVDSAEDSACGGWASAGTEVDPHWLIISMDGAGLAATYSGVRVVLFAGSVRRMNQSLHGIFNIAEYHAGSHAEDHAVLMARCSFLRPQLCQTYVDGYVTRKNGTRIYVKFMLSADKQGLFHIMGSKNMNYDAFGAQCDCKDSHDDMYNLTFPPLTHFDHLTFAKRVGRAHVPMHEATEQLEPADYTVDCDVCGKFTKAQHLKACAAYDALDDGARALFDDKHARAHFGQNIGQEPVLPYNDSCSDVLHMYLNVMKAAYATVFHRPFQIAKHNYSPEVTKLMSDLRDKMNERMDVDFDDKHFGGEGTFSLHGDQVKVFMRGGKSGRLIPDLLTIIEPYFALLESDGKFVASAAAPAAPAVPKAVPKGGGRGKKKGAMRGGGAGCRGAGRGATRGKGTAAGRPRTHSARVVHQVVQPEDSDDELDDDETPEEVAQRVAPVLTYKAKVLGMFLATSAHWMFIHSVNSRDAKDIWRAEREELARRAYNIGCEVVRAVVAVCGDEQRQTYLHDMAYGMQKLFLILGKPYLGATEGNEHAHQEMKKDFKTMCCHSNSRAGSMLQLMELSHLRRQVFRTGAQFAPRTIQSQAVLGMDLGVKQGPRKRKQADLAISRQDKLLEGVLECELVPSEPFSALNVPLK